MACQLEQNWRIDRINRCLNLVAHKMNLDLLGKLDDREQVREQACRELRLSR